MTEHSMANESRNRLLRESTHVGSISPGRGGAYLIVIHSTDSDEEGNSTWQAASSVMKARALARAIATESGWVRVRIVEGSGRWDIEGYDPSPEYVYDEETEAWVPTPVIFVPRPTIIASSTPDDGALL